jgi:hypothetical protein
MRRANWPRSEITAAVRAGIIELFFDTLAAKRALECADHRFGGIRRQVFIATFAIGAYFEHKT